MSDQLLDLDLCTAAAAIEAGSLDPVELTEAYLARIETTEPDLNAYVTVDAAGARADACRARDEVRDGLYRGPLHGIPVGVKDVFDTAGLRTTYGSVRYAEHVPTSDAVAVARLRNAGAVLLGKHATHEFAWGGRTDNPHFGATHNPHDHARIPGGSSGGGAASVVARSSMLALGSDTAGSVRIPAALCGCVGFKPSRGWMAMTGAFPLAPELDHAGLLGREVADVALAARVLSGTGAEQRHDVEGIRVGLVTGGRTDPLEPGVAEGLDRASQALQRAGAEVTEVEVPDVDERALAVLTLVKHAAEGIHRAGFRGDPASFGPDLAELLSGDPVDAAALAAARHSAEAAVLALEGILAGVEVLMSATVPVTAPLIGEMEVELAGCRRPVEPVLTRLTSIANVAGWPAISVPAPDQPGLPVGVQFLSVPERTPMLLGLAGCLGRGLRD